MWRADVIFRDSVPNDKVVLGQFKSKLQEWADAHRAGDIELHHMVARNSAAAVVESLGWGVKIKDCLLTDEEVAQEWLTIGPYAAYKGTLTLMPEATPPVTNNFAAALNDFFAHSGVTPEEKEVLLDMSLRNFLTHCKTAAEAVLDTHGTPAAPHLWGVSKKAILTGARVKCPQCQKGPLQLREGQVGCPLCGLNLGDIDDMAEIV